MDDDQQFCLRWNNHQSTLISVFDTLLENETLVDCTLAAEGKFLKAHKVVLSACSPYFATLLQEQYDKHPIFILKDVKYQELRAMMDYMYRGEVNISQDQLAALLKAAESLQIKGLSDNRTGGAPKPEQHHRAHNVPGGAGKMGGYTLEQTKRKQEMPTSREGSSSPSRPRKKVRRRSVQNAMPELHENSNSSQMQANQSTLLQQSNAASLAGVSAIAATAAALAASQNNPVSSAATTAIGAGTAATSTPSLSNTNQQQMTTSVNIKKTESVKGTSHDTDAGTGATTAADEHELMEKVEKQNHKQQKQLAKDGAASGSELVIEPKSEYDDDAHDENVEDLTLDDEDMGMDDLDHNAGTSQGGEGSSQGYAAWQHDRSQDELLLATQEAQQRDPQDLRTLYNIASAAAAAVAAANSSSPSSDANAGSNLMYNSKSSLLNNNTAVAATSSTSAHLTPQQSLSPNNALSTSMTAANILTNTTSSNSCSSNTSALNNLNEVFEPEISIRKMYKCCLNRQQQQNPSHTHVAATSCSPSSPPLHSTSNSTGNCSGCQISAAASLQLANFIGSTMLLPQAMQNVAKNVAASKAAAAAVQLAAFSAVKKSISNVNSSTVAVSSTVSSSNSLSNKLTTATSGATTGLSLGSNISITIPKKTSAQFHCEFCSFSCSWKYDLKLHMRQKHGIHNKKM